MIAELHEHGSVLSEYWDIVTSPSHLMAELSIELISASVGVLWHMAWVKRHDRKKHGLEN